MATQSRFLAVAKPAVAAVPERFRVAIIARDLASRTGMTSIAGSFEQLEADDFLVSRVRVSRPDAILCDSESARDLRQLDAPVVVLIDDAARAAELLAAGAHGVLLRDAPPRRMHAALIAAAEHTVIIDDALAPLVLHQPRAARELLEPLTAREQEVMQLLASGQTNKEIAKRLHVTEHTVKFHVNGILGKLGVATRTEAV